jgi:eukaryotic-like serine/threonine-protein kinase
VDGFPQGPQWAPGTAVGDYEVVGHIASGGMAEVYAAVPRRGGEPVVIKAMSPKLLANDEFLHLFLDEARLIATLNHANIARIFDRGELRGTHYFIMEYVVGVSARDVLHRATRSPTGRLPLSHAIEICCDIAAALHYAHERRSPTGRSYGIVHRDVSHSNVLVDWSGSAKLIDFGVAKSSMRSTETKVGSLKGKVQYMAPEQLRGEAIDRRCDLFALGILLWEMTTGHRLFRASNEAATMHKILFEEVQRPSEVTAGYPPELERIIMAMLARRAVDRPATAEDVLRQLEQFAERAQLERGGVAGYLVSLFGGEVEQAKARYQALRQRRSEPVTTIDAPAADVAARPAEISQRRAVALPPRPVPMLHSPVSVAPSPSPPPSVAPFAGANEPRSATRQTQRPSRRDRSALLAFLLIVVVVIGAGLVLSRRTKPPGHGRSEGAPRTERSLRSPR